MQTVTSIPSLRNTLCDWRAGGQTLALVPTMGNLHEGHLQLVKKAGECAERVVVSIFVNPAQFGPGEDFGAYPRTPDEDSKKLTDAGAHLLFMPSTPEVYPAGAKTFVEVPGISDDLCGGFRPGHFRGVTTVVCKLFNMVQPDVAVFGEKDYQQLTIIRRMTDDLNLPVEIVGVPTVREKNGLALSSRNGYLSSAERQQAAALYRSLLAARTMLVEGIRDYRDIEAAQTEFLKLEGFRPDYFAIRRSPDLAVPTLNERHFVILVAAWLGRARLIDNVTVHT